MGLLSLQWIMQSCVWMQAKPEGRNFRSSPSTPASTCSASFKDFSAFFNSPSCTYRSPTNLYSCERVRWSGRSMRRMVETACSNSWMAVGMFWVRVLLIPFCLRMLASRLRSRSVSESQSSKSSSRVELVCLMGMRLSRMRLKRSSLFCLVKSGPSAFREGSFRSWVCNCGSISGFIAQKRARLRSMFLIIYLISNNQQSPPPPPANPSLECCSLSLSGGIIFSWCMQSLPRRRLLSRLSVGVERETSQSSLHSSWREGDSEKFLSFNQSFSTIEQNDKLIAEKTSSLAKIRALEDELRSAKLRSCLWDRVKTEIVALNKYLGLTAIAHNCSQSAISGEFFQAVAALLEEREAASRAEKGKTVEGRKREKELGEKLGEANKKKYDLEQRIVQLEHEMERLQMDNCSLRQKSKIRTNERSSKIREFHEETLLTIQMKDEEVLVEQARNQELKEQIIRYEELLTFQHEQLEAKEADLAQTKDSNEELYLHAQELAKEGQQLRSQVAVLRQRIQQLEQERAGMRAEMQAKEEENAGLRAEVGRRAVELGELRGIIEEARVVNEEYQRRVRLQSEEDEERKMRNMALVLQREQQIKKALKVRSRKRRAIMGEGSQLLTSSDLA